MGNMQTTKENIIKIVKKIVDHRGNPLLVLDLKYIDDDISFLVYDLLAGKSFENLDVILQTPGGNIGAAFRIIKFLRSSAKNVNIIVPYFAKSAGTLICLGANKILVTDISELGPLDTQIYEDQGGGTREYISALNGFKALEKIQKHTVETLDIATILILQRSGMKISEAIRLASEFSGQTSGTLYSKLNPMKIGEYARALEIGRKYGLTILTRYMGWKKEDAMQTVSKLVEQYPSHDFSIDFDELIELGLPAVKLDDVETDLACKLRPYLIKSLGFKKPIIEFIIPKQKKVKKVKKVKKAKKWKNN